MSTIIIIITQIDHLIILFFLFRSCNLHKLMVFLSIKVLLVYKKIEIYSRTFKYSDLIYDIFE